MALCLKMKSDYSFLSSTITFADAISYCKNNKVNHLSLIDNNLFGAIDFYNLCNKNNIKPIIGVELNVKYNEHIFPLNFIAKSEVGYKNISRLYSLANKHQVEYIDFKVLSLYSEDVILLISSFDSYLTYLIENNLIFEANEFIEDVKKVFKYRYLGVYRYNGIDETKLNKIKEYSTQVELLNVACQYATHLNEKDTVILNLLDCMKKQISANKEFLNDSSIVSMHLKSKEQLKVFYDKDELNNLQDLINLVNLKITKVDFSLPQIKLDKTLKELSLERLKELSLDNNQQYLDRINYEISIIEKMGFENYYLVVSDYVSYAKSHNIPVGPARGSGGASLIAYLLNITTIDPLKYDLLFERFLNPSRINYPDFDIDFSDIKREQIIEYVKEKYGYRKVANIATFANFGVKSAIRDMARLLKIPSDEVDYICKTLSNNPKSINDEYKNNEKFKSLLDIHGNYKTLCSLASRIEGLKKQVGLHAAGIILSEDNIDELVPTFEHSENTLVIAYDYINAESLGLIKMDFLGLKNLSIIEYCIEKINEKYNKKYTFENIPYDDKKAYELIANGFTFGLFQLESEGMNNFITKLKPNCFDDIVALLALYRPGPMDMIETYINRKHGASFEYIDESIKDILASTYGIIIYQEQIMQICQKVANYSLGDADILRRAISKKKLDIIKKEKDKFIKGCIANSFSIEKANKLFAYIEKFADYGFNKAHSVGYSKLTSMMAYLKAYYPEIYYEALLNVNNENNDRRKRLFNEAKKLNITILKPDVKLSSLYFKGINNSIRYGLANITSIKENIASLIINERNKADFNDIYDFIIRMVINDVSLQVLTDLNYSGALDCFNISRDKISSNLSSLYQYALMFKGLDYKPNTYNLDIYKSISTPLIIFKDEETDFIKKEYEMLNYYISTHPIKKIKNKSNLDYKDITAILDDGLHNVIAKIVNIELFKGKDNKDVVSLTLEDETSVIKARSYFDALLIKENNKKGSIVYANITKKGNFYYLNSIKKMED